MRKKLLLILVALLTIGLVACGDTSEDSSSSASNNNASSNEAEQTENNEKSEEVEETAAELGIGDTAEVDGVKFTLKNVTTTDERNEFADTDPAMVVKIEYEIENGSDSEIPIGTDLEVYDGTGNKMESYPLDNTMGSLQPGKKMQGVEHFGIEEGPIEIYFAPLISFEDPAIFKADVQ